MKKHNKFFLIILILMFGVKMVSAQGVETDQKFYAGIDLSLPFSLKHKLLHTDYGGYLLLFFKEKAFYVQAGLGYMYFRQEAHKHKFVRASTQYAKGGVRLPGFEKISIYLNGGVGLLSYSEKDYVGGCFLGGIKLLYKGGPGGMAEVNLNFINYIFIKGKGNEEVVSLGVAYWLPIFKSKSKQ